MDSNTTTEIIFRPPYLSRSVLGLELMKILVPGPTVRWHRGAYSRLVAPTGIKNPKHLVPGGNTNRNKR